MKTTFLGLLLLAGWAWTAPAVGQSIAASDTARLRQHLRFLTTTPQPRNYQRPAVLDSVAAYIQHEFRAAGASDVGEQPYAVRGQMYRNVLGSFGPKDGPRLIIGAHYDVCGEQPGADDNGTGVAALLELARLLGQPRILPYRIDLVAYTLEEPPFFPAPKIWAATYTPPRYTPPGCRCAAWWPSKCWVILTTGGTPSTTPSRR